MSDRDLHDLFRRDVEQLELPPPGAWLPGESRARPSRWSSLLAVPALAGAVVLALAVAFILQLARGDLPAAKPPVGSPSATVEPSATAPASTSPSAAPPTASASPARSAAPLPASNAVQITGRLPAEGQWALVVRRTWNSSPTEPNHASGPPRLPLTDSIMAVPLSARATTPRDTIYLLSFTSRVDRVRCCDNLLREQFSPDGRRLVLSVISSDGGVTRGALVVVDLVAGTAQTLLSDATYHDLTPAWNPASDEIAFVRNRVVGTPGEGNDAGIWVVRADGTGLRQVLGAARAPEATTLYSWNASGTAIGYARGFEGAGYSVLEIASGKTTTIGSHRASARAMADWRTARTAFAGAFMEGNYGGLQYIVTADEQGTNARDAVTGTAVDGNTFFYQARWRPGADDILYVRSSVDGTVQNPPVEWRLFVTDANGRTPREVKRVLGGGFVAAWTPDGRDIVYVTGQNVAGSIYLIAPDGSNERLVQAYGGVDLGRTDWIDLAVLRL